MGDTVDNPRRMKLRKKLLTVLGNDHLYYDPPEQAKMKYPAIIYSFYDVGYLYANGKPYVQYDTYEVTIVSKNDDETAEMRKMLPRIVDACDYIRSETSDNLHHHLYRVSQF